MKTKEEITEKPKETTSSDGPVEPTELVSVTPPPVQPKGPEELMAGLGNSMQVVQLLAPLVTEVRAFVARSDESHGKMEAAIKIVLQNQVKLMSKLEAILARLPPEG